MGTTYNPKKIEVIVDGISMVGFAEDSIVEAERMEDKREMVVGAKGDVDFIENADDSGTVTITLKHNSPSNAILKDLYDSGKVFDFAVVDQNFRRDVGVAGSRCKVASTPTFARGDSISDREWTLLVADYEEAFGV